MIIPYELWLAFYDTSAPILYTLIPLMNSIVHALLYTYYTVVLAKQSGWRPLRKVANVFYNNRGRLTYIQYTQFPTAVIVSAVAAIHPDGILSASVCYGLIGAMNAVLFAPLLPFFKKRQRHRGDAPSRNKGLEETVEISRTKNTSTSQNKQRQKTVWVVIEGRAVDVTAFQKVHPGGARIISKLAGRDVTHHFRAFHPNLTMVRKILASLPNYVQPEGSIAPKGSDANASAALEKLEADMRSRGFFDPPQPVESWKRIVELVLLFTSAIPICLWGKNNTQDDYLAGIVLTVFAGVLWGFASGRCGWLQHDAGHKSLFASRAANVATQALCLTVGMSGASFEWNRRHNEHHAVTNEHHADPDINTTPLLMFYDEAKAYRPPSRQMSVPKWVLKYQAVLFTPLLCPAVALAWALYAHPLSCIRRKDYKTLLALGASHTLRALAATKLTATSLHAVLFLACIWVTGPAYLFTLFAMSHTTTPVRHDDGELHWARSVFRTTVDASPRSAFASWFSGNLNCQVAHHLWPGMPTSRLSALTDDVAKLAKDLGESYHCKPVTLALKDMYAHLNDVGIRATGGAGHAKIA
jgi:fatty acid desaturase 2 (delta-6 desaturase)